MDSLGISDAEDTDPKFNDSTDEDHSEEEGNTIENLNFSDDEVEDDYFDDNDQAVYYDSDEYGVTIGAHLFLATALEGLKKGKNNYGTQKNQLLQE